MMKLFLCIIALTVASFSSAQEVVWTRQSKISEAIAFEKSIDPNARFLSQNVSLSSDYYPLASKYRVSNPVIVNRKVKGYLPVYVEYFYTPGDSILRLISYDWEKDKYGNLFAKQKLWQEESKKLDVYNQEYEKIKTSLINQIGKPGAEDTAAKEVKGDRGNYYTRSTVWESELIHADLNLIFEAMTYRIRFTLYWKK